MSKIILNLGCGSNIHKNAINCNYTKVDGVNILLDLNRGLPFKDNTIDGIKLYRVIAHTKNPSDVLWECIRVLKPGRGAIVKDCKKHCPDRLFGNKKHNKSWAGIYIKPKEVS